MFQHFVAVVTSDTPMKLLPDTPRFPGADPAPKHIQKLISGMGGWGRRENALREGVAPEIQSPHLYEDHWLLYTLERLHGSYMRKYGRGR